MKNDPSVAAKALETLENTDFLGLKSLLILIGLGLTPVAFAADKAPFSLLEVTDFSPGAEQGDTRFTRLGEESGVDFVSRLIPSHPQSYLYHSGMTCSGLAVGDLDGNGRPDLFLANGPGANKLFLQQDGGKFTDVTAAVGAGLDGGDDWASGVSLADVDNDGDLDLFVCNYDQPNQLYLNMGAQDGAPVTFKEVAAETGLAVADASHVASFCDYDNDGDLDLYLLTNRIEDPDGSPSKLPVRFEREGIPSVLPEKERYYDVWIWDKDNWGTEPTGRPDYLFRNDGVDEDGQVRFTDVTNSAGIAGRGDGLSVVWWDADMDGDCDLYVCNDFITTDCFYINNGDGTFTNSIAESMPHTPWFSMGSDFGDLDNDGDFDLMVADMSATTHYKSKVTMGIMGGMTLRRANASNPPQYMRNALFLNEGQNRFREAAFLAGLASSDWTWSVKLADFDSDGNLDVYLTNGVPREMNHSDIKINQSDIVGKHMWEIYKDGEMRKERNLAFRGEGDLKFKDVGTDWGLDHMGASYGAAWFDLEGDGDLDLVVMNLEENVAIYRNDGASGNQITLRLKGTSSNRYGIGAVVEVHAGDQKWVRQLMPGTGYHSYNEPILHFGLGEVDKVDRIVVRWPGGKWQQHTDVPVNKQLTITESNTLEPAVVAAAPATWFKESTQFESLWHQDKEYDDFAHQPLLPHRLSVAGPGMAWGDVDGDGDADLYFGGGADQAGELRLRQEDGSFKLASGLVFMRDRACEDQGALFLDIDCDGDQDLLVASGSYEFAPGDEALNNRLYLNDGSGSFTKAPSNALPQDAEFSGALAATDFDHDGDPDVFVGTRARQGEYPAAQTSRLLVNEGGRLRDATQELAPGLEKTGLVTAAVWSDADGDGWRDLLVAHEWGPVKLFKNVEGKKLEPSPDTGEMAKRSGWWNGLAAGDIDGDGDIDYLATNIGKNTKYKTSDEKPMSLYYGDFDNSGKRRIVEVKVEGSHVYPERGRSCSSNAMPFIAKKFPTFHDFGLASLTDIYGEDKLKAAGRFEANTFYSGVFINDGKGHFVFKPLPRIAQISPGFGCALGDWNGDGHLDAAIAQNFFGPQSETGHYDGGMGQILAGDGSGNFEAIPPAQSGFIIREPGTALTVVDLNLDGAPDLVAATNNGPVKAFINTSEKRHLQVDLGDQADRVELMRGDERVALQEVHDGSGYLSQSAGGVRFTVPSSAGEYAVRVRWFDGTFTTTPIVGEQTHLKITQ